MKLTERECEACGPNSEPVRDPKPLLAELPEWRVETHDGIPRLTRTFAFKNFAEALAFTNRVGSLAEAVDHHPALLTEWGRVTVSWWTHSIGGLHLNDFILAARTDAAN